MNQYAVARGMKNPYVKLILLSMWPSVSCSDPDGHGVHEVERASVIEDHPAVSRLNLLVIPKVDISDATPEEAFDFVRQCLMADDNEPDATRGGVSMVIRGPKRYGDIDQDDERGLVRSGKEKVAKINFSAKNVPYFDLLAEVARQAEMDVYLTSVGFMIIPEGASPFPNTKASEGEIWKVIRQTKTP